MHKKTIILFFPLLDSMNVHSNYPWALIYLERMVREMDVEVILIDERLVSDYTSIIQNAADNLLFAGISAMVGQQIANGINFYKTFKTISNAPVIWGGWFPTVFPEMLLRDGYADYVCVGQGEKPFQAFTEKMISGTDVTDIAGIGRIKNGEIVITPNERLTDPSMFPRADLSLININHLIDINEKVGFGYRGADYLATIGCPYNCSFCNLALVFGRKWFAKTISEIFSDLKYLKEHANVSHITFGDDNFFAGKNFIKEFCNEMIKSGLSLTWEANAHAGFFLKHFKDNDVQLMYNSGCRRIKVGAESGDQEVLDLLNKKTDIKDNLKIVKLLKRYKIQTRFFTMVCFPINPDRDFWKTLNMIGKAKLIDRSMDANINYFKPIPKTPLYQLCLDSGFKYPITCEGLIDFFSKKYTAPWLKKDYQKSLDDFVNFYFLLADPKYFLRAPAKKRLFVFLMNIFFFPAIYLRFKFNLMKIPIEARIFKRLLLNITGYRISNAFAAYTIRNRE